MIRNGIAAYTGKRVLLLQGPMGPFFRRLAQDLEQAGAQTLKVNFNGGDWFFSPRRSVLFRGSMDEWPAFFERLVTDRQIDIVMLFGDCRPIHRTAHEISHRHGLEIGVFEEGYVRPDHITLERFGVNGYSLIPRTRDFYLDSAPEEVPPTISVGRTFPNWAGWAMLYYLASALAWPLFRKYRHHRPLTLLEGWPWVRSAWRKLKYRFLERHVQDELSTVFSNKYFLVPLQVHNDAQVRVHSDFDSVRVFIDTVVTSFFKHAPPETLLVIKHHPMDRGYRDHRRLIGLLGRTYGIQNRLRYIHDQHLPTLLEHARGVVVVNSTVGFSALHHGTPVKVCGTAIYDIEGLTFQGSLDDFWGRAADEQVDHELYRRFRSYVVKHTQLNGSYYRRLELADSRAGLVWPTTYEEERHAVAQARPETAACPAEARTAPQGTSAGGPRVSQALMTRSEH